MDEDMRVFITEWLKDGQNDVWNKSLSSNSDMIEAIFSLIEEWKSNKELFNILCIRLFGYYRESNMESKVFSLQFVPSLIYSYLSAIAQGERKDAGSIQTFLLAIYNLEAGGEAQNPKTQSFRIPNIAQPSIYHDTSAIASSSLTESALKRLDPTNRITVKFGPHPHLNSFNAENRLPAMAALLRIYSNYLSLYSKSTLSETCMAFRRLVAQGYTRNSEGSPRIPLSSNLLIEMLHLIYSLTMEDEDLASGARQTLEAVQRRVEMELMAAPMLLSAAMADSSHLSIKGEHSSPQLMSSGANGGSARAMWKSMITNASFRTKKLPDDITIAQVAEAAAAAAAAANTASSALPLNQSAIPVHLVSITEENDEPSGGGGGKSSFRLSELVKKKSKPKPARNKPNSNGGVNLDGSSHHPHLAESNGVISNPSDRNSDCETKEDSELRRRSSEFNGTQV
uniref:EOG090X02H3 n=1 Tax=Daphnia lumholtzi TaxID=42856 RepID=A0A4Y7MDI8_9CRUS|nr:EOG090X02H3 [Daphnia lumholtzi]SVE77482.1 EOG090X02H3 [Daphnia lumholtzi]SVE78112.1 EOG090X02H3 [Daphnia lumholtzi]SVE78740.1 EOG090X02H3 [Daphnia lumholtzi]